MANIPHGGVLKVRVFLLMQENVFLSVFHQDLIVRDSDIAPKLREEAASLPDIILTEVPMHNDVTLPSLTQHSTSVNFAI